MRQRFFGSPPPPLNSSSTTVCLTPTRASEQAVSFANVAFTVTRTHAKNNFDDRIRLRVENDRLRCEGGTRPRRDPETLCAPVTAPVRCSPNYSCHSAASRFYFAVARLTSSKKFTMTLTCSAVRISLAVWTMMKPPSGVTS